MLTRGQDFAIEDTYGIPRCVPKTPAATSAFKALQEQITKLLPQLPNAPQIQIEINGIIGPTTALGTQTIALRLAEGQHRDLADIAAAQPEEAIPLIAERAMEIAGYVNAALEASPTAILTPKAPELATPDPIAFIKGVFTPKRVIAGLGTVLGLGALALLANAASKRQLGVIDRSSMLPPSDGTDAFEDDDDTDEDGGDDALDDGIDRANAIDVEAVEVPGHAA